MLHTLILRLRACRHPMRAWLSAKRALPEADRSIERFCRQSKASHS